MLIIYEISLLLLNRFLLVVSCASKVLLPLIQARFPALASHQDFFKGAISLPQFDHARRLKALGID